jgi:hypothetical protein
MSNPAISRDVVHAYAEACSDEGDAFQPVAARLVKEQRRLSRFFEQNAEPLGMMNTQVAIYMLSVCMRVFDRVGGRMRKVNGADIKAAQAKVEGLLDAVMPADDGLCDRAKAVDSRAQPHLLDEVLWALYEREDDQLKEGEQTVDPQVSALIYIMLWTAVEALDASWKAPKSLAAG